MNIGITGTGSYWPKVRVENADFLENEFCNPDGSHFESGNQTIIEKFKGITGIAERCYAEKKYTASDLGFFAAEKAIADAGVDKETIDQIIVAHNFGDVPYGQTQGDTLPSLASRIKHKLHIQNPNCVAYDLLFGCPGWVQGFIQAHAYIKAGMAKRCLVVGTETLSRVSDPHDRDSMIYSDGAGAVIVEAGASGKILNHVSATYANGEAYYLFYGESNKAGNGDCTKYIKMYGRKIYEFAVTHVPQALKKCLDQSGASLADVKKIFIHQANEKMDEAIVKRFYKLYGETAPEGIMPMIIDKMGNNSVATVPILFDRVRKGLLDGHEVSPGDVVIFASVGAGMNINAVAYQI